MYGGKLDLCHMQNTANVSSMGEDILSTFSFVRQSDHGVEITQRDQPLDERYLA